MKHATYLLLALALCAPTTSSAQTWNPLGKRTNSQRTIDNRGYNNFLEVMNRVADMTQDQRAQALVQRENLNLINLTWEDTGRFKGSSVGPNISDLTIQVAAEDERGRQVVRAMPVIRTPNFSDTTGDIDPDAFSLMVGNEHGSRLQRVSLRDVLADPTAFLTHPESWRGRNRTLLSGRDEKVLMSAQACFLPVKQNGLTSFNPVLFNYQSVQGDPAVLTILATREGTSMTVIDNTRDPFSSGSTWGQRLFFNNRGRRASLTAERMRDFANHGGKVTGTEEDTGLNMVLVIQVPLKQHTVRREFGAAGGGFGGAPSSAKAALSDTENAVIGHGQAEGPFTEIDNLAIERDVRFPVRVTVQFYKATSTGSVSPQDVHAIRRQIDDIYSNADTVGSLVTSGETGRPTEYWGCKVQPASWWQEFWARYEGNTGESRREAIRKLQRLLGPTYEQRPVTDLYVRDLLR